MLKVIVPWFAACARARSIKFGEGAGRSAARNALEAVKHVVIVKVGSHDSPLLVDAKAPGALAGACARARSTKCGDVFERLLNHMQEVRHLLLSKAAVDS